MLDWNPGKKYRKLVKLANRLLEQERRTVRDVYYAFESRNFYYEKNGVKKRYDYKQVKRGLNLGRKAGMVDPSRIIDTSRRTANFVDQGYESQGEFLEEEVKGIEEKYFKNFWKKQKEYVEVWVEKAGLVPLFHPICQEWNIRLEPLGGDWSLTECYNAAVRFNEKLDQGQDVKILYFGDYNPSGFHTPIAVQNNIQVLGIDLGRKECDSKESEYFEISPNGKLHYEDGGSLELERIALNTKQTEKFDLPANPAPSKKDKDRTLRNRFMEYVSDGKDINIELNALKEFEREYLKDLIKDSIKKHADTDVKEKVEKEVQEEREELADKINIQKAWTLDPRGD